MRKETTAVLSVKRKTLSYFPGHVLLIAMALILGKLVALGGEEGVESKTEVEKEMGTAEGEWLRGDDDYDGMFNWWEKKYQVSGENPEQMNESGYKKSDMAGWWPLDDAVGSTVAKDRSNNGKNLLVVPIGTIEFEPSGVNEFGYGHINLGGGYLEMGVSGVYDNLWAFTYSVWVKTVAGKSQVVGLWRDVKGCGWELGINEGGKAYGKFVFQGGRGGLKEVILTNGQGESINGGVQGKVNAWDITWHHLVLVNEGWGGKLYVDGKLEAQAKWSESYGSVCSQFQIGAAGWNGGWYVGLLKEARLYRYAAKADEVELMPNVEGDPDGDGLKNWGEYVEGTNPREADSDGDGLFDGIDATPLNAKGDADNDGLSDVEEVQEGTEATNADSDGDGMGDGWEVDNNLDPLNGSDGVGDADGDGKSNLQEYGGGTDPWDYYDGDLSDVEILVQSGNGQVGHVGGLLGEPVEIKIVKGGIGVLKNAPVTVRLVGANVGELHMGGLVGSELFVKTASSAAGGLSIGWKLGLAQFAQNQGEVEVVSGGNSKKVSLEATGVPGAVPLSGLKMWLNGEKLGAAGEKVSVLEDWSKNNNDAEQGDASKQGEVKAGWNGKKVVSFDGVDDELEYTAIRKGVGHAMSVVLVYEIKKAKVYGGPLSNLPPYVPGQPVDVGFRVMACASNPIGMVVGEGDLDYVLPSGVLKVYRAGLSDKSTTAQEVVKVNQVLPSGPILEVWGKSDGNETLYYRGGKEVGVKAGPHYASPEALMSVGGKLGRAHEAMEGDIGEVLVWDRVLSESERESVEGYLKERYGLTDEDGDGVAKWQELEWGLDPTKWDSNGDGVKDGTVFWFAYGYDSNGQLLWKTLDGTSDDIDGDGLSNAQEYALGTNPWWNDSDGDGAEDGFDVCPLDPSVSEAGLPSAPPVLLSIESPSGAIILP